MKGSILAGAIWMFVISVLLFWLPVAGPLIAGYVGGKKAGSLSRAILAVFLPAIVLGVFSFFFATVLTGIPIVGFIAGMGGFIYAASHVGLMLLGAILGGIFVE